MTIPLTSLYSIRYFFVLDVIILGCIHTYPSITSSDLMRNLDLDHTVVTRALNRLENSGLITRTRSVTDKRKMRLALTAKGLDVIRPLMPA